MDALRDGSVNSLLAPRALWTPSACHAPGRETLATYAACHGSVMSVGSYKGKSHCGPELAALRACVFGS